MNKKYKIIPLSIYGVEQHHLAKYANTDIGITRQWKKILSGGLSARVYCIETGEIMMRGSKGYWKCLSTWKEYLSRIESRSKNGYISKEKYLSDISAYHQAAETIEDENKTSARYIIQHISWAHGNEYATTIRDSLRIARKHLEWYPDRSHGSATIFDQKTSRLIFQVYHTTHQKRGGYPKKGRVTVYKVKV